MGRRFPRGRLRFTFRGWMVVVAIFALLFGFDDMRRRRNRALALKSNHEIREQGFRTRAEMHAKTAALNEAEVKKVRDAVDKLPDTDPGRRIGEFADAIAAQAAAERSAERAQRALADFHKEMRLKYEHAARTPWLPIPPDPEPPFSPSE